MRLNTMCAESLLVMSSTILAEMLSSKHAIEGKLLEEDVDVDEDEDKDSQYKL